MEEIDIKKEELSSGEEKEYGILNIVSTPIGNNEDISFRAIKVLGGSDLVICEEIKTGARLLRQLNISKKLDTLNVNNEEQKTYELLEKLKSGKNISLISDAGTPIFEDPGLILVREALKSGIEINVVPGVTSIMTALVRSGFNINQFLYAGFLSRNKSERILQLRRLSDESHTVVFLETPYRLLPILEAASQVMPSRNAYLGMNLTMKFETHHYGTFKELYDKFKDQRVKGEFVICFEGAPFGSRPPKKEDRPRGTKFNERRPDKFKRRGQSSGGGKGSYKGSRGGGGYRSDQDSGRYRSSKNKGRDKGRGRYSH